MIIWEPWETALPAGVALAVLVAGAWRARAQLRPHRGGAWLCLGVFVVSLLVRVACLPLEHHVYDGHEAEYYDIFRGVRPVSRGGTVLYPSLQWAWAGLGHVLPRHPAVPIGLMIGVGAWSAVLAAWAAGRFVGPGGAWAAGLIVATHPAHVAWSASAYNVALPLALGGGALAAAAWISVERTPPRGVALAGAGAFALAVGTRLELALIAAPAGLLVLVGWWARPGPRPPLRRTVAPLLPPLALALGLSAACAWPLVVPGGLPGDGEHAISACAHRAWAAPFRPWDSGSAAVAAGLIAVAALVARPAPAVALLVGVGLVHGVMGAFDDYADRHALIALPTAAVLAGLATSGRASALGTAGVGLGLLLQIAALPEMYSRYYASEEAFVEVLRTDPGWSALPRWTLLQARADCGWVNEDPRAAAHPALSHFNLLDPLEADAHRGPGGCLRWCMDLQDWRWSSRGVQDRALRLQHLYRLQEVAVVEDPGSGYACLVVEVGPRLRCAAPSAGRPGGPASTAVPAGAPR